MKVAFVSGSNKGIGLAIVEQLLKTLNSSEWHVYLTARDTDRGKQALEGLHSKGLSPKIHQLDIDDASSRATFLDFMKTNYPDGINIAVHNAGIAYKGDSTAPFGEQARVTCATNFFHTVDFVQECMPFMATDSRVVVVSSQVSHMALKKLSEDLYKQFTSPMDLETVRSLMTQFVESAETGVHESKGWPTTAYGTSKLGLTKACYILAESLATDPRNIVLNACCPGYVATDMSSFKGHLTTEQGADTPCYLALLPSGITSPIGEFVAKRTIVPWTKETQIRW